MYYDIPEYTGPFKDALYNYVEYKRSLGHDYGKPILYRLREIDLFFKASGVANAEITEDMFELWSRKRDGESAVNRRRRVGALIEFSKFLVSRSYENIYIGTLSGLPPTIRFVPYIFSRVEIATIFDVLQQNIRSSPDDAEMATFAMMICLYYGCGLRKTEAQRLTVRDFNASAGSLRIMDSKNHASRLVLLSETITRQLADYCDRFRIGCSEESLLFTSGKGTMFSNGKLYGRYSRVLALAGISPRENGKLPRIHDLRHTFCVHTLETMVEKGFDLYVSLPLLVAYLGHNCIFETEYYLRLVDENFTDVTTASQNYAPSMFPKVGDLLEE